MILLTGHQHQAARRRAFCAAGGFPKGVTLVLASALMSKPARSTEGFFAFGRQVEDNGGGCGKPWDSPLTHKPGVRVEPCPAYSAKQESPFGKRSPSYSVPDKRETDDAKPRPRRGTKGGLVLSP